MPLPDGRAAGVLERGTDAMWLRQQITSRNIANVETPDYRAKKVKFKNVLRDTAQGSECLAKLVVKEDGDTQAKPDGDNVQAEREELEL